MTGHDFNRHLVAPKRAVLFSRYLSLQLNVVSSRLSWVEALLEMLGRTPPGAMVTPASSLFNSSSFETVD